MMKQLEDSNDNLKVLHPEFKFKDLLDRFHSWHPPEIHTSPPSLQFIGLQLIIPSSPLLSFTPPLKGYKMD